MRCLSHGMQAIAIVLAVCWATPSVGASAAVLIRSASLIGGASAAPEPVVDLLIEDGVIQKIGEHLSHPDARVIDVAGKTVLPGLIDCHSHLNSVPGAALRGDPPRALEARGGRSFAPTLLQVSRRCSMPPHPRAY